MRWLKTRATHNHVQIALLGEGRAIKGFFVYISFDFNSLLGFCTLLLFLWSKRFKVKWSSSSIDHQPLLQRQKFSLWLILYFFFSFTSTPMPKKTMSTTSSMNNTTQQTNSLIISPLSLAPLSLSPACNGTNGDSCSPSIMADDINLSPVKARHENGQLTPLKCNGLATDLGTITFNIFFYLR